MTEPKKDINFMKYWPLAVGVLMLAGTWAGIKSHMNDDSIHINEGEKTLSDEEYKNLLRFATQVEQKLPEIESQSNENNEALIQLQKEFAVFNNDFMHYFNELDGLESKVSRNYVELRGLIEE